jgi:hypothetical protein
MDKKEIIDAYTLFSKLRGDARANLFPILSYANNSNLDIETKRAIFDRATKILEGIDSLDTYWSMLTHIPRRTNGER